MSSKYHEDDVTRKLIDDFLRENAHIECHLGTDSTIDERRVAREKQYKLFQKIKMLDEEFYKLVIGDEEFYKVLSEELKQAKLNKVK